MSASDPSGHRPMSYFAATKLASAPYQSTHLSRYHDCLLSGGPSMRRREFLNGVGAAAAWPLVAHAQHGDRLKQIGVLSVSPAHDTEWQARFAAFLQSLRQLGWIEGSNIRIETRSGAATDFEKNRKYAAELVALAPDVLLAATTIPTLALQRATRSIPIVFAM